MAAKRCSTRASDSGDAGVATRLTGGQRLALLRLALDVHLPALGLEASLAATIDIAFVAIKITTSIRVIQDILQVQGVVLRGGADLDPAAPLVAPVGADRDLIAESGLAVLLCPGGLGVLPPSLGQLPIRGHRLFLQQCPFLLGDVPSGDRDQTGIHDLPTTGDRAVLGELAVHRRKKRVPPSPPSNARGSSRMWCGPALGCHVSNPKSVGSSVGPALGTPSTRHSVHINSEVPRPAPSVPWETPDAHRAPVPVAAHLSGQRLEVNMLLHHLRHIAQAVQFGFAFLGGKQAVFDRGADSWRKSITPFSHNRGFSRCPVAVFSGGVSPMP